MKVDAIPCSSRSGCECRAHKRNEFHPVVKTARHRCVWPITYQTREEAVKRGQALLQSALGR